MNFMIALRIHDLCLLYAAWKTLLLLLRFTTQVPSRFRVRTQIPWKLETIHVFVFVIVQKTLIDWSGKLRN